MTSPQEMDLEAPHRVSVNHLRDLIDVNRDDLSLIQAKLEETLPTRNLADDISDKIKRRRQGTSGDIIQSLSEVVPASANPDVMTCLGQILTVFHDPSPPPRRGSEDSITDGSMIKIRIESNAHSIARSLEAVILLTGQRDAPFWIMDWSYPSNTEAGCDGKR